MARATINDISELPLILAEIRRRMRDWMPVWDDLEKKLPRIQDRHWNKVARKRRHSKETRQMRQKRRGYYKEPGDGKSRFGEWTGRLIASTTKMTKKGHGSFEIDPAKNYPRAPDLFRWNRFPPFDEEMIEKEITRAIERWMKRRVLRGLSIRASRARRRRAS